ncbi:hypothetical protein NUU61_000111 [Penicillium alfredii]|uniref:Xylanolytic transcriptional activator regulatory domain-containing protein n=1 Tax=Penicillium alfredii TaxID=1506179 RepID=A0A9W9GA83_9EURO|nr:uncharacterized protein NUU61_000111 [Penicillium alfredii]KAJ5114352.1 hypothetical protein NUU61_000111 [Penicillium alfredii]
MANEMVVEGQSSLSAHSTFAIQFLKDIAGSDQAEGASSEIGELLNTLGHIVDVFNDQRTSPSPLFPRAQMTGAVGPQSCQMPPIQTAVAVLRDAQAEREFSFLHAFDPPYILKNLSDLCLKVYFSQDYSDAEFIILNLALYCKVPPVCNSYAVGIKKITETAARTELQWSELRSTEDSPNEYDTLASMCETNIETALSGLSLYVKATYDMILALVLGTVHAVDTSKPSLAWTLISAASQGSYSLGYHTRSVGADRTSNEPNEKGLLFWAVYSLERFLSLRLGRSSTIPDCDITVPLPGSSQGSYSLALDYCGHQVKLARLAGQVYKKIYSAKALLLPVDVRRRRVIELSQELNESCEISRQINERWVQCTTSIVGRQIASLLFTSDEVAHLSMLTLVQRAMPAQSDSGTLLSTECANSAREALEQHQKCMAELRAQDTFVVAHLNWTIFFVPFAPFIVLFCHVIETGAIQDLARMQSFVTSIESACRHSKAIAKHHRLFQVFYSVALRHTELRWAPTPTQEESLRLRMEMDAHLSALGLPQTALAAANHSSHTGTETQETETHQGQAMAWLGDNAPGLGTLDPVQGGGMTSTWEDQGARLGNWFSFNQHVMELLDHNDLPF